MVNTLSVLDMIILNQSIETFLHQPYRCYVITLWHQYSPTWICIHIEYSHMSRSATQLSIRVIVLLWRHDILHKRCFYSLKMKYDCCISLGYYGWWWSKNLVQGACNQKNEEWIDINLRKCYKTDSLFRSMKYRIWIW